MKIGLWNLEEKKVENTALMQVSQFHKQQRDQVELFSPLYQYDRVYVFSLFTFTKKPKLKPNMIAGGTGFDVEKRLPPEIESCDLDYSIYPKCKTSYLWFSRGCFRGCPFCVVMRKEGTIYPVKPKNLNPNGKYVSVMDNNPFANPKWEDMIKFLIDLGQPVNFQSGIDVRIFNDLQGLALQKLRIHKQINIAWDNPKEDIRPKIEHLLRYVSPSKVQCYVLVEYWSTKEEDLERIYWLRDRGLDPYVMPFKKTRYALDLSRWCNTRKALGACPDFNKYNRREFELLASHGGKDVACERCKT